MRFASSIAGGQITDLLRAGLAFAALSCAEDERPIASLRAMPELEVAPAAVIIDASSSSSPKSPPSPLEARFDYEGDGTFDTSFSSTLLAEFTYDEPGRYAPRVEIVDRDGESAFASVTIEIRENSPPRATLAATPREGASPLRVVLDASGSVDPDEASDMLEARFDFEADGTFDTDFSRGKTATHMYHRAGEYVAVVEIRDSRDVRSAVRLETPIVVEPSADLDADTDRDGVLSDLDDEGEESWSAQKGAVFLANVDDDDDNGRRDSADNYVSGSEDVLDLAPLTIRQYPGLSEPEDSITITVTPAEASREVRLFLEEESGAIREIYVPGGDSAPIPPSRVARGDTRIFVEGIGGRRHGWDGLIIVTLTIDRSGAREEDSVALRCAPIIFPDNTLSASILYVMRIAIPMLIPNLPFFNAIRSALPDGVTLYAADEVRYSGDRWVQDNMQAGYQALPIEGGTHFLRTYLETERQTGSEGLEYMVTRDLLAGDLGYVYPGGRPTSLNYGGNLEIAPAHEANGVSYPFGRILVGGGRSGTLLGTTYEDHMATDQRRFLDAQGIQGPSVELSTEWLAVGHLDEIFQFVPDLSGPSERPWKLVLSSPALAVRALQDLADSGLGRTPVFAGRETETTVLAILNDDELMATNQAAQARIDSVRDVLTEAMGLTSEDIVEVPVLYESLIFDGFDFAAAYSPGMQNLVSAGAKLWVPDPEGPDRNGSDVLQALARDPLERLGLDVEFVDIFESYHLNLGEAHCGVEIERAPSEIDWWEKE